MERLPCASTVERYWSRAGRGRSGGPSRLPSSRRAPLSWRWGGASRKQHPSSPRRVRHGRASSSSRRMSGRHQGRNVRLPPRRREDGSVRSRTRWVGGPAGRPSNRSAPMYSLECSRRISPPAITCCAPRCPSSSPTATARSSRSPPSPRWAHNLARRPMLPRRQRPCPWCSRRPGRREARAYG